MAALSIVDRYAAMMQRKGEREKRQGERLKVLEEKLKCGRSELIGRKVSEQAETNQTIPFALEDELPAQAQVMEG
jgi:hypothetical protein